MPPKAPKCEGQVGDKCKIIRPKAPRVGDKCGRQVWETSVNSCGPKHLEWETNVGDKGKISVNSCGPRHPECETSGRRCKLMRPKATRVGDMCGGQVENKWETSANSCSPRHPE